MNLKLEPTDVRFLDSPDAGDPDCFCSRCGEVIEERCAPPIRALPAGGRYEYRFHPHCLGLEPCCSLEEDPS